MDQPAGGRQLLHGGHGGASGRQCARRGGTKLMQRLLLVEDDPNLNFTILTALEAQGYSVDAVSTTGEAIERLSQNAYPIVLTDIYIDERTGLDVLVAAKRKDPLCAVILMTGRLFQSGEPSKVSMPSPNERAVFLTRAMSASDHCAYSPIS